MNITARTRLAVAAALLAALATPGAAGAASCTAQFTSAVAPFAQPFGQVVVVPEVRALTFGGPNLGQEVKVFFATADPTACPIAP